ncbi:C40 family peptidase, partial [Nocardioides sp.]|uniref:C40 family peptidase n=1 Tax=Nocardioides sp. TaxID=35761 RepID=UPI002610B6F4
LFRSPARAAAVRAGAIAEEKAALVERLAELQNVSVRIAQRRQSELEARAAAVAAAAAAAEQDQAEPDQAAADPQPEPDPQPSTPSVPQSSAPEPSVPQPAAPQPSTTQPSTPAPPAPASGAQAAIAFARAQVGEPYRWGAAGPGAWDCSGLTMAAWGAGDRSLPHYSVAQYEQSTPISAGQLRPGDLVFWGSSSDPGSIYHVALYVGDGRIVHAPRTGRPVTEESMYYWIPPTFYARP